MRIIQSAVMVAVGALMVAACAPRRDVRSSESEPTAGSTSDVAGVPYVALLATPTAFEGKNVRVIGFASIGFERNALYASEADFLNGMDGIWLRIRESSSGAAMVLDRRYVIVFGRFTATRHGHMGVFVGELDVQNIGSWSNPRCPVQDTGNFDGNCPNEPRLQ